MPFLLQVENRVPKAIPIFVIPATIDIKVEGLVAAATYTVFSHKFQKIGIVTLRKLISK